MINHLFKLIWKKRKSNFLIMLEIFVAFLILFAVSSLSVYFYKGYIKPAGINAENVWVTYITFNSGSDSLDKINVELVRQKIKPIVITQHLKEEMFGTGDAIGALIGEKGKGQEKIVGVIPNFKHQNDYQVNDNCIFQPTMKDVYSSIVLKTDPSVSADFEAHFAKSLQQLGKDWTVQINHMDEMKKEKNENIVLPLIIAFIVCGFLIINVAFGLFGVLFQNITRRKGEIGVRRAVGATGNNIKGQFIGEMLVLATFSLALGVFFAVQFPILNVFDVPASVYILGILLAVLSVYLLVVLCAWFPSRQAAAIHPAVALHDE